MLAVPRAYLTIIAIPPILKVLGLKKAPKGGDAKDNNVTAKANTAQPTAPKAQTVTQNTTSVTNKVTEKRNAFANIQAHIASASKKGGN